MNTLVGSIGLRIPAAEDFFDRLGIEEDPTGTAEGSWAFQEVPLTSINKDKSLRNQARLNVGNGTQLIEDNKEKILVGLSQGHKFPAIVLYIDSNGDLVIADGNHRVWSAEEKGIETVGAYVLNLKNHPDLLRTVIDTWNLIFNGATLNHDERLQKAVAAVQKGMSQCDAAKMYAVSANVISDTIRLEESKAQFGHFPGYEGLAKEVKMHLPYVRKITSTNAPKIITAICSNSSPKNAITQFLDELQAERDSKRAEKLVHDVESELKKRARKLSLGGIVSKPKNKRSAAANLFHTVNNLYNRVVIKKAVQNLSTDERNEIRRKLKECLNGL